MKKTILLVAALSVTTLAMPIRVLAFPWGIEMEGTTAQNGLVDYVYETTYGRNATPTELTKWSKAGFPDDDINGIQQKQVAQSLKDALRESGNPELKKVINRAYKHAIGRNASAGDETYWTNQIVNKKSNQGYSELLEACRNWLRDNTSSAAIADRKYAISTGFLDSFGREPNSTERANWLYKIKNQGKTYTDILVYNANYILGTKTFQKKEFSDTIKRAYQAQDMPEPNAEKIAQIRIKNKETKRTFKDWKEFVKKFG